MKKRILSVLMAACLSAAVLPAAGAVSCSTGRASCPQYENALRFSDGLAAVRQDNKWGYIDETGEYVIAAYALGIVNGRREREFDPYTKLNRQEAAAFLMRAANVLGMDTASVASANFADEDTVETWFRDAVNYVAQIGVMNGKGGNRFDPTGSYSREQSFVTIYRLFEAFHAE